MFKSIIATAACLVAAACAAGPSASPAKNSTVPNVAQTSPTPSPPSDEPSPDPFALSPLEYVEAVANNRPEAMRQAAEHVALNSPAAVYLNHIANVTEAELDGGVMAPDSEVTRKGDVIQLCSEDSSSCVDFGAFKVNQQGQLVSFKANGNPIAELVSKGNGQAVRAGGSRFTFLTSYLSQQSDALFVVMRVRTGSRPISLNLYSSTYRSPRGNQRTATTGGGPTEIQAESTALVYSAFLGVEPGGVVTFDGCIDDCADTYDVAIKTR